MIVAGMRKFLTSPEKERESRREEGFSLETRIALSREEKKEQARYKMVWKRANLFSQESFSHLEPFFSLEFQFKPNAMIDSKALRIAFLAPSWRPSNTPLQVAYAASATIF